MPEHSNNSQDGFSYIGLLILIAIIGSIASGTLSAGASMERRLAEEELLFIGQQFQNAFKTYYEFSPANGRRYPLSLDELLKDPRFPGTRRHLRKLFMDPITGQAEWGTVNALGGGIMGVYSLAKESTIKRTGFDPQFLALKGKSNYSEWFFGYIPSEKTPIAPCTTRTGCLP